MKLSYYFLDIETSGLNTKRFICGCLMNDRGGYKVFNNRKKLMEHIINTGKKLARQKKGMIIYAHNCIYDFYGTFDPLDKNITYMSDRPFIAKYNLGGGSYIRFLDTMGLFRMSLKRMGEIVGKKKIDFDTYEETEDFLIESKRRQYMINDCDIIRRGFLLLKEKLKEMNINIKWLISMNQIGIKYYLNKFKEKDVEGLFHDKEYLEINNVVFNDKIHKSYRGGRVEAFKTGSFVNSNYVDVNSLYPFSSTKIMFPIMNKYKWFENIKLNKKNIELLKNEINVSRCMLYNKECKLGCIPIRTNKGNYYPKKGKLLIGTYTNYDIKLALENGYKLISIEWSIFFRKTKTNPFKEVMNELYKKRKEGNDFDNYFYKQIMNTGIGKFGQHRVNTEIKIDECEKRFEYLKKGYEITDNIDLNFIYKKSTNTKKKYYCPIIPALITSYSRAYMWKFLKAISENRNLLYTDTDSIIFTGSIPDYINISNNLGEFSIEKRNSNTEIFGKKTYKIENEIVFSGLRKTGKENKNDEIFINKKMITIKNTNIKENIGTFKEEIRDINESTKEQIKQIKKQEEKDIQIDCDIEDISFFIKPIQNFIKSNTQCNTYGQL